MTITERENARAKRNSIYDAIERVIEKQCKRGATDRNIYQYLEHLKTVWRNDSQICWFLNDLQKEFKGGFLFPHKIKKTLSTD